MACEECGKLSRNKSHKESHCGVDPPFRSYGVLCLGFKRVCSVFNIFSFFWEVKSNFKPLKTIKVSLIIMHLTRLMYDSFNFFALRGGLSWSCKSDGK